MPSFRHSRECSRGSGRGLSLRVVSEDDKARTLLLAAARVRLAQIRGRSPCTLPLFVEIPPDMAGDVRQALEICLSENRIEGLGVVVRKDEVFVGDDERDPPEPAEELWYRHVL